MSITHYSEFSGIGGTDDGARFVPGVVTTEAANHDPDACEQHALNFPEARHYQADVTKLDMRKMPRRDLFTASPACPAWTDANGLKRDFDKANAVQSALVGLDGIKREDKKLIKRIEQYKRSRLLMYEVVKYLRAKHEQNPRNPVMIGFLENVIQCRLWAEWDDFIAQIHQLDYHTKLIAYNSMHGRPVRAPWPGQSRNRLFLAWWHKSIGRHPDFDKWLLRPRALCPKCDQVVHAVQSFKKPGADMGSYGAQYIYRCPNRPCQGQEVIPEVMPALSAINLSNRGVRIGDRERLGMPALADATIARIDAGRHKHWGPLLVPVGGTWRGGKNGEGAHPLSQPAPARTTRETDGVALPPLMVPVEARAELNRAHVATDPARTMTTRNETGLALPFITPLRGGGCKNTAKSVLEPANTITASGNHHGLASLPMPLLMRNNTPRGDAGQMVTPVTEPARTLTASGRQSLLSADASLLVACASRVPARPLQEPAGTLTTRDRFGVASAPAGPLVELPKIEDIHFRMLDKDEVGGLMGFGRHFRNEAKSKRTAVRLYGNAVTPNVSELLTSALVEALTGEELERYLSAAALAPAAAAAPDRWGPALAALNL